RRRERKNGKKVPASASPEGGGLQRKENGHEHRKSAAGRPLSGLRVDQPPSRRQGPCQPCRTARGAPRGGAAGPVRRQAAEYFAIASEGDRLSHPRPASRQ